MIFPLNSVSVIKIYWKRLDLYSGRGQMGLTWERIGIVI
jgi:hypothetical protein